MPTYHIYTIIELSATQKVKIAQAICDIHTSRTGALSRVVQTIFTKLENDNHFLGGLTSSSLERPIVWINITCKAGRSDEIKKAILQQVAAAVCQEAKLEKRQIMVYMHELEIGNTFQLFDDQTLRQNTPAKRLARL